VTVPVGLGFDGVENDRGFLVLVDAHRCHGRDERGRIGGDCVACGRVVKI
jgi:hypothetical protein